jgi:hypothetical protein
MYLTCPWQARTDPILSIIYPTMDALTRILAQNAPWVRPRFHQYGNIVHFTWVQVIQRLRGERGGRFAMTIDMFAIRGTFTQRPGRWREVAVTIFKTTVPEAAVALNSGFVG